MIGILCGLKSEAEIADKIPNVLVGCSAAQVDRAKAVAEHLVQQGCRRLISFGLAGATSPDLRAGDLLLGATAMSAAGAWEADAEWNDKMIQHLNCFLCAARLGQ
jgi:uridine phosphorylase